jgi:hypothetical protein
MVTVHGRDNPIPLKPPPTAVPNLSVRIPTPGLKAAHLQHGPDSRMPHPWRTERLSVGSSPGPQERGKGG